MHYAHERGILHRDLKPSNVLLDAQDQPHVVDFGLAKRFLSESVGTRSTASHSSSGEIRDAVERVPTHVEDDLTLTGQVPGSPNYMPPEQATGKRGTVSRRSDVYALGAILYHALTGRPPFVSEGLAETVQQVLNVEPVSPRVLNPSVPADLETVCLKCLEKEPGKRYATAQMLAEELGRFLEGKSVMARPVVRLAKAWRWCRRNPRLASAIGVAFLSLVIGLAGVTWQWRRAESQRARAEGQSRRAETEELFARRNAYAADMKEVQRALEESDLGHARELLNRQRPVGKSEIDLRGWEWRYFWSRCQSDERLTLSRSSNSVSALAFSPDGKWLAVRRGNQTHTLWDAVAKRPTTELPAHGLRWCKALAFSPQENLLAWCGTDASGKSVVRLRDLSAQKEMAPLPHSDPVASLAFSPNAKTMATLACDGTVRVWDVESQQVVTQFLTAKVDIQPDRLSAAAKVTTTSAADGTAGRRKSESQPVRTRFATTTVFTDHYGCVLFSPDGRWLAVGEAEPRIRLLDRVTGKERIIPVPPSADGISALAFSPDSNLLAAGCGAGDNDIHVWDVAAGTEFRLAGHSGWVAGLAFSPDGQTLASASADQTLRLWEVARKAERRRFQGNTDEVWAVAWSPDGQDLVTGARDGSVRYWNPAAKPAAAYAVLPEPVHSWGLTFLPDGKTFLAAARPEGAVARYDTASVQVVERLSFLGTNHTSLELSRDGRWLALGDAVGNIQVWDFNARQLVTNLVFPECAVLGLWFSPRGNVLDVGGWSPDGRLVGKLWAVAGWRELNAQGINVTGVFDPSFSPNEGTLALGYGDGTAAWWDLATRQRTAFFEGQSSSAVHVAFSPDGRLFATGGLDGLMTVWDVPTRQAKPIVAVTATPCTMSSFHPIAGD